MSAPLDERLLAHLGRVLEAPEIIQDRWRVERRLGAGGMGSVFLAHDLRLDRPVAVKVLAIDVPRDFGARLEAEALTVARLEHPGVCPIHDVGRLDDGRVFCVMRYIAGRTLDQAVREKTCGERVRVMLRVLETLAFAHERCVVHRDIKPSNIMVGEFGETIVVDWGIAISSADAAARAHPRAGTPEYMAPEQRDGRAIDGRTDVYGAGKTLAAILDRSMLDDPLGRRLSAIIARAVADDPAARYDSARAFAADLTRALDRLPVLAYRETPFERLARLASQYAFLIWLVIGYIVLRALVFWFAHV